MAASLKIRNIGKGNPMFGKKKKNVTSLFYGVRKIKGKWVSVFSIVKGKQKWIGTFKTEVDAAIAYDKYIIENKLDRPLNFSFISG